MNHKHDALYRYWEINWRGRKGHIRLIRLTVLHSRAYLPPGSYGPRRPLVPRIERLEPGTYQLRWYRIVLLLNLNKYRVGFKSIDPTTGRAPVDRFGPGHRDDYAQILGRVHNYNPSAKEK